MNGDWRYYLSDYFPSDWHCARGELARLHLDVLYDITNRIASIKSDSYSKSSTRAKPKNQQSSLMVTIPLDPDTEGPLVLEPEPGWKLFHHMDTSVDIIWTDTKQPGRGVNVTSVTVHHGASLSSETEPINLALHTPFIQLPGHVYDSIAKIAEPEVVDMGRGMEGVHVVNCNSTGAYPNIIFDLEAGVQQLVIKPQQYILKVSKSLGGPFSEKCVFLLKSSGGELEVGFAALRGRTVWFDWANARTGFQS